jgi:hypothetical protein
MKRQFIKSSTDNGGVRCEDKFGRTFYVRDATVQSVGGFRPLDMHAAADLDAALSEWGLRRHAEPTVEQRLDALQARRDEVRWRSFLFMDRSIQCRRVDEGALLQLGLSADRATDESWPAGFAWRCADNSWLPLTRAQAVQMSDAYARFVNACFAVFGEKEAAIKAGQDVEISGGWPE